MFDGEAFGQQIVASVKGYVDRQNGQIVERLAALEAREPERGEPGQPGEPGQDGRDGVDGKDADPEAIRSMVAEAIAELPVPTDGRDGVDGKDGKDGAGIDDINVEQRDGRTLALSFVRGDEALSFEFECPAGPPGEPGAMGEKGEPGKDGVGVVDILVRHGGGVVFTLGDGRTKELDIPMLTEPDSYCPDETAELVSMAKKMAAEAPDLMLPTPEPPAPAQPIVVNVHGLGDAARNTGQQAAKATRTITTRKDAAGNLVADVIETPIIEEPVARLVKTIATRTDINGQLVADVTEPG